MWICLLMWLGVNVRDAYYSYERGTPMIQSTAHQLGAKLNFGILEDITKNTFHRDI